jgi:hypothetical protein
MKIRLEKNALIMLINERAALIANAEKQNLPCTVADIVQVREENARANWTWNQAYSSQIKCAEIVGAAVDEFQKTHDVVW